MEDLGVGYYQTKVEITIDALNVNLKKLNKEHELYEKILKAKENEIHTLSFLYSIVQKYFLTVFILLKVIFFRVIIVFATDFFENI